MTASADFTFLFDLGLAVFAALGFSYLFSKIKQPVVVGQLVAGIIIGPFGLGLIQNLNTINLLASLGIILLLFTVGLELDPLEIKKIGPDSFILAIVELTVTFVLVTLVGLAVGLTQIEAIFAAAVVATTSTAIMSKILLETKSLRAKESHTVVTASVIEDFATVFMLLLLPGLAAASNQVPPLDLAFVVLKGAFLVGVIFVFGWRIAPYLIDRISRGDQEFVVRVRLRHFLVLPWILTRGRGLPHGLDDQRPPGAVRQRKGQSHQRLVRRPFLCLYGNTHQYRSSPHRHTPNHSSLGRRHLREVPRLLDRCQAIGCKRRGHDHRTLDAASWRILFHRSPGRDRSRDSRTDPLPSSRPSYPDQLHPILHRTSTFQTQHNP